jgi:transcriptional regulator with XRE-family HTH domain
MEARRLREARRLSRAQVAVRVGQPEHWVRQLEYLPRPPAPELRAQLMAALGLTPEEAAHLEALAAASSPAAAAS